MEDYSHLKADPKKLEENQLSTVGENPDEPEGKRLLHRMKYISHLISDVSLILHSFIFRYSIYYLIGSYNFPQIRVHLLVRIHTGLLDSVVLDG